MLVLELLPVLHPELCRGQQDPVGGIPEIELEDDPAGELGTARNVVDQIEVAGLSGGKDQRIPAIALSVSKFLQELV